MIAVLHNIRSRHNVGSIFRTADAAGIKKIYLCGYTPEPLPKVSLGAEKFLPWEKCKSTTALIGRLKKDGFLILAIEQSPRAVPYYKFKDLKIKKFKDLVLVFGNEVKGLPPAILKRADKILEIPMYGKKESLNVAVAFGVVVFGLVLSLPKGL